MASRKDQKEKLRQERLEREAAAQRSAERRKRMGYVVAGVLVAAVIAALAVVALAGGGDDDGGGGGKTAAADWPSGSVPDRKITDLDEAAKAAGCTLRTKVKSQGRGHVEERVTYETNPPTSGSHSPMPSSDRAYVKSPPIEQHVHSLEHGRVIYWFASDAPAEVRGDLKALYDEEPELVVLAPYNRKMDEGYQVAATAWQQYLGCPAWNDKVPDAFRAFRDAYRLKGPEYVPNPQ